MKSIFILIMDILSKGLDKEDLVRLLLKISMIKMAILFTDILPLFTMRMPPYMGFEKLNYLSYSWDKLRI